MENWQRHGALPTGATLVRAQLSATAWSQKKHSRTQTKVQEAEVHLDYKTLDGTVHTVVDKAQRIGDGQIKVVYGLTSRTLALKMASEQRVCVHLLMLFERMTVRNQFLFCVDPKHGTHTACLCYWVSWQCMEPIQRVFAIGFSCRLSQKIDTACLCYSVFCVLDVKDRSYVARKERVLFSWSFLGQSRQIPQNSDPKDLSILHIASGTKPLVSHLHLMFNIMCLPLFTAGFQFDTIQFQKTSRCCTLCQVLNLWSATYTWCSVSCACHCSLLLAGCLFLSLILCCFKANVRCATCSQITSALRG